MHTSTSQFVKNISRSSVSSFRDKPINFRSFRSATPRPQGCSPGQWRLPRIMPYLDDWLICAPSHQQIVVDTESVLSVIQSLGFQVNLKKSDLNPRQETSFLGLCLNSLTMRASLTPQRVAGIQATLRLFRQNRRIELLYIQRTLGLISAAAMVVPLGLLSSVG